MRWLLVAPFVVTIGCGQDHVDDAVGITSYPDGEQVPVDQSARVTVQGEIIHSECQDQTCNAHDACTDSREPVDGTLAEATCSHERCTVKTAPTGKGQWSLEIRSDIAGPVSVKLVFVAADGRRAQGTTSHYFYEPDAARDR